MELGEKSREQIAVAKSAAALDWWTGQDRQQLLGEKK